MKMTVQSHATAAVLLSVIATISVSSACTNEPPVACVSPGFQCVAPGGRIQFDGTSSYDPDGYIADWMWSYPSSAYNVTRTDWSRFGCNIDTPGSYYFDLYVTDNEGSGSADGGRANVVSVQTIQYYDPDPNLGWSSVGALYVALGTTVTFRALPWPTGSYWPSGVPVWGGTSGASGTGGTTSVQFNTLSTSLTDYKTVTVTCGGTLVVNVVVYELYPYWEFFDDFEGRARNRCGLQEYAELAYMTDPDGLSNLPIAWKKLSGVGSLNGTSYYAEHTAGSVSLRCEVTSGPSAGIGTTYNWSVVAPSGASMTRVRPNNVWHIYSWASAGIALYYWLGPTDVSFSALDFGEGSCPATNVTGDYVTYPPGNHAQNGPVGICGGDVVNGCRVSPEDHAWEWAQF